MSPSQSYTKQEINHNEMYPSHSLKIYKNSHVIKKSPSSLSIPSPCVSSSSPSFASSSLSTLACAPKPPPRQPVIIYTHSPKVIHTNPNDFMALVQKLTGLSGGDGNPNPNTKEEPKEETHEPEKNILKQTNSDESESSVVTDDSCPSMILEEVHVNSSFPPTPFFDPNINPCFQNIPMFMPNDYLSSAHHPFYNNYADPLFMPNVRNTISSPTNLDAMIEFRDF